LTSSRFELFIVFGFRRSSRCQRRECFGRVVQWLNGFCGWDGMEFWVAFWGVVPGGAQHSTAEYSPQPTTHRAPLVGLKTILSRAL